MRPITLRETLIRTIPTKQPIWVWGPPAVGKSSIIRGVAETLNMKYIDIRAALLDPVDLRGVPYVQNGKTYWATPDFLPSVGPALINFDELTHAVPVVQGSLLQLTLDRMLGEYRLPDDVYVIAASNRAEDRAGGHRVITSQLSRFLHLDLEVSNDDWQAWAVVAGIAPEVRAFINARPTLLHKFDPSSGDRSFPAPRTWEFVSRVLPVASDDTLFDMTAGCVGPGPAAEFVAFVKVYASLPDVNQILANPAGAPVPKEPDVLYAVCAAVVEKVRGNVAKLSAAAVKYLNRLPKEFGVLLFRDLVRLDKGILTRDEGRDFLKKNRDLLVSA